MTALAAVAATSEAVGATSKRLAKRAAIADLLRRVDVADVATVVTWLSGELRQRQIGVGWASLRDLPAAVTDPGHTGPDDTGPGGAALSVASVDAAFDAIKATTGPGSQARRAEALAGLFTAATPGERRFLRTLLGGELRQGALAGVVTDAVAEATGLPAVEVRRAVMLRGDLGAVAGAAVGEGAAGLREFRLEVGRPIAPMLAQTATDTADALQRLGEAAVESKLDGARIQVHRDGGEIAVFSRSLDDVTARMPGVVAAALALPARAFVLDGEAMTLRADGGPAPFQETASTFGRRQPGGIGGLQPFWFDLVHLDGADLLDAPLAERVVALDALTPPEQRVRRVVTADPAVAQAFYDDTVAARHEGVVVKGWASPYEAGRRGGAWLKVKPVHTLDLVVLAVEWGSGRRRGWLSNLHLGARADGSSGSGGVDQPAGDDGFVMLGKTFKGLTDETLRWQTERFLALAAGPTDGYVVRVRPEQVVEIAFDGVQRSTRYPGGVALRFARVLRYRDDKSPEQADTLATVRSFGP